MFITLTNQQKFTKNKSEDNAHTCLQILILFCIHSYDNIQTVIPVSFEVKQKCNSNHNLEKLLTLIVC